MVPTTRRNTLRLLGAAGVAGLAGCGALGSADGPNEQLPSSLGTAWTSPDDEWRYPRAGLRNTAQVTSPGRTVPKARWSRSGAPFTETVSTLIGTAEVLVSVESREPPRLRGHDPESGAVQWQHDIDGSFLRLGGVTNDMLVMSVDGQSVDGAVVALNPADGSLLWRRSLYDQVVSAVPTEYTGEEDDFSVRPRVTRDRVCVQSDYGLHGLDPADGSEQWRIALRPEYDDAGVSGRPGGLAVGPDGLLTNYGVDEGVLLDVTLSDDGADIYATHLPESHVAEPVVTEVEGSYTDSYLAAVSVRGTRGDDVPLVAVAGSSRSPRWTSPGFAEQDRADRVGTLATDGTRVVLVQQFRTTDGVELGTLALDATSGGIEWAARRQVEVQSAAFEFYEQTVLCDPIIAGETVITGYGVSQRYDSAPESGVLVGYDVATGEQRWQAQTDIAPNTLAAVGTRLYIGGGQGMSACSLSA